MGRPDPIEYAERLYGAIRTANFSPLSFLAFGNAVKDGVAMRNIPRIAAEPFMRVVGEMLDLEMEGTSDEIIDAVMTTTSPSSTTGSSEFSAEPPQASAELTTQNSRPQIKEKKRPPHPSASTEGKE
jgi:hypothetical protein